MHSCLFAGLLFMGMACQHAVAAPTADPVSLSDSGASASSMLSGWAPFVDIDLWRASDAVPISEFESDWSKGFSPRAGRNVALMRNRVAVGVANDRWRMGYEARQAASLDTDRDTLEMVRLYKQRQDPAAPMTFPMNAHYTNWSAHGIRIGRYVDGVEIAGRVPRLFVSVAWYTNPRYRKDDLTGSVRYLGGGDYAFDANRTNADSRAVLPFMDDTPGATGMSLSVAADVPLTEALSLGIRIDDLWARLRWRNLPVTTETINSDVASTDSEGYLNYRPLLSGRNQQLDKSVTLPRYGSAVLAYRAGAWRYAAQVERFAGVTIPTLMAAHEFGWGTVSARVETRFRTIGLGFEHGNFRLLLQADTLRHDQAKAQAVQLGYIHPF